MLWVCVIYIHPRTLGDYLFQVTLGSTDTAVYKTEPPSMSLLTSTLGTYSSNCLIEVFCFLSSRSPSVNGSPKEMLKILESNHGVSFKLHAVLNITGS